MDWDYSNGYKGQFFLEFDPEDSLTGQPSLGAGFESVGGAEMDLAES